MTTGTDWDAHYQGDLAPWETGRLLGRVRSDDDKGAEP
jgi:hypothetical protein